MKEFREKNKYESKALPNLSEDEIFEDELDENIDYNTEITESEYTITYTIGDAAKPQGRGIKIVCW